MGAHLTDHSEVDEQSKRASLPIPDRGHTGLVTYDAKDPDTSFPPIEPLRPPKGAPNVLIILLDDVGFGASSAFGGPCNTRVAERLAAAGLKYNRFHTTALCAPTRQAMLTGRNHHSVGMGAIPEIATSAPGYSSVRPNTAAPHLDAARDRAGVQPSLAEDVLPDQASPTPRSRSSERAGHRLPRAAPSPRRPRGPLASPSSHGPGRRP